MYTDDQYWNFFQQQSTAYDGVFYIGVVTTRIYCRPSCSAKPLRKNVKFYVNRNDAVAAGFRPCKRCHPESISPEIRAINTTCRYLEQHIDHTDLKALAAMAGYSPFHFTRLFKAHLGVSPKQYSAMIRRSRIRNTLQPTTPVSHAAYDTGYQSLGALYADMPLGMTPRQYRTGGKNLVLEFDTAITPFGILIVVTTEKGICFVGFADNEHDVMAVIHDEFPAAQIIASQQRHHLTAAVRELLVSQPNHTDIPLDIRATAFQQRVWHALRAIPYGQTQTYQQIAHTINQPQAVRAVANACAHNPVAVVVPCHRVVHTNATREGYRWSVARKRAILAHEHTVIHQE